MMENDKILNKLTEIFRENFDDDSIVLKNETAADDIEHWDSLEQINLIARIEHVFSIQFDISETLTLSNVGEMAALIAAKIKG